MRALLQRVSAARVDIDGETVGQIDAGLLILICAMQGDTDAHAIKLTDKISKLRIFKDDSGRMNRSLLDTGGAALVVSQFTLAADTRSGNRRAFPPLPHRTRGKDYIRTSQHGSRTKAFPYRQGALAQICKSTSPMMAP